MWYVITVSAYCDHRTSDHIGPALVHRTGGKNPAPISSSFSPSTILSLNSWILSTLPSFVPRDRSIFGLTCWIGEKLWRRRGWVPWVTVKDVICVQSDLWDSPIVMSRETERQTLPRTSKPISKQMSARFLKRGPRLLAGSDPNFVHCPMWPLAIFYTFIIRRWSDIFDTFIQSSERRNHLIDQLYWMVKLRIRSISEILQPNANESNCSAPTNSKEPSTSWEWVSR